MSTTTPSTQTQLSDIIFPEASRNISQTISKLSTRSLSIRNRLHSINSDAQFIQDVAVTYPDCAVVANERCGGWYVESGLRGTSFNASGEDEDEGKQMLQGKAKGRDGWSSAYFKSTDGHFGIWNFSLRRLNLGLFPVLGEFGGDSCIIVDSTRRGKHLPDALSKTIPIWCAVMNLLLFPEDQYAEYHHIVRLPELISESEHAQMEAKLPESVAGAKKLDLDISELRKTLQSKPLRPSFIARSLDLHPLPAHAALRQPPIHTLPYHPLYLTMASTFQPNSYEENNTGYVQGAGDDNEMWSQGLTSAMWWQNRDALLRASEEELPDLIESITSNAASEQKGSGFVYVAATKGMVGVGGLPISSEAETEILNTVGKVLLIVCCASNEELETLVSQKLCKVLDKKLFHLRCGTGKVGSRDLRKELKKLPEFIANSLSSKDVATVPGCGKEAAEDSAVTLERTTVLVADTEGGLDIATGVALALLSLYTNDNGEVNWSAPKEARLMDKATTTKKLSWITTSMPAAKPAGTTLKAVNEFLFRR